MRLFNNKVLKQIDKINNTKSELISYHHCEIRKTSSQILKGLSPTMLAFTFDDIYLIILEDSVIFSSNIYDSSTVNRMFWNEIDDYEFKVKINKKLFGKEVVITFNYNNKGCKVMLVEGKKDTNSRISQKTLSFLLSKINT